MKIAGLTQTYGNRVLEMNAVFSNKCRTELLNKLDRACFSFHNVPSNTFALYREVISNIYPNNECVEYNNVPYGYTINSRLKTLRKLGFSDIFFCQDDHYLIDGDKSSMVLSSIFDFYKSRKDINILHISSSFEEDTPIMKETTEVVNLIGKIKCNKFNTLGWNSIPGSYAYDDSPYFAKIDFLLENVFSEDKLNYDVWNIETSTSERWKTLAVDRWICNSPLVYLGNFSGRNINSNISTENKLKQIKGEIPSEQSIRLETLLVSA